MSSDEGSLVDGAPIDDIDDLTEGESKRRTRKNRPYPTAAFEEVLLLGAALFEQGGGRPVRRITLFDTMGRAPESGTSRQLITNSSKYGISTGSYKSDHLELTPLGRLAVDPEAPAVDRLKARFELALTHIPIFERLYGEFKGNRLPALNVLADAAKDAGISEELAAECAEIFVLNCKFIGVLRSVAGAERFLSIEHLVEEQSEREGPRGSAGQAPPVRHEVNLVPTVGDASGGSFDEICFYVTPIGEDGSEARRHSDLFMGTLVEPVLAEFGLKLVRADKVGEAGLITSQIIEHIARSRLVVADLSFHNPNVFYEVALRHAVKRPIVQLIRKADRIPFDVQPVRTIVVDTTDIYTLVPQIELYRTEIAAQVRTSLEGAGRVETPLNVFYPAFWSYVDSRQA